MHALTVAALRRSFGITLLLVTVLTSLASAQSSSRTTASVRPETIRGAGGWPIHFSYYPALETIGGQKQDVKNAPVLLLIHGSDGNRLLWDKTSAPSDAPDSPFAAVMQQRGFAVLAVDMRKHGESAPAGENKIVTQDYELMVADLMAIKEFLFTEHQAQRLNMRKLAILAMDSMVPVAVTFAELDWKQLPYDDHPIPAQCTPRGQDVKAIIMISPETGSGRVQAANSLRFLSNPDLRISFLTIVGKKDSAGARKAQTIFRATRGTSGDDRVQLAELDTNEKSAHLFGNRKIAVEIPIIKFLDDNVAKLSIPWQDRRSRLDRDN